MMCMTAEAHAVVEVCVIDAGKACFGHEGVCVCAVEELDFLVCVSSGS